MSAVRTAERPIEALIHDRADDPAGARRVRPARLKGVVVHQAAGWLVSEYVPNNLVDIDTLDPERCKARILRERRDGILNMRRQHYGRARVVFIVPCERIHLTAIG